MPRATLPGVREVSITTGEEVSTQSIRRRSTLSGWAGFYAFLTICLLPVAGLIWYAFGEDIKTVLAAFDQARSQVVTQAEQVVVRETQAPPEYVTVDELTRDYDRTTHDGELIHLEGAVAFSWLLDEGKLLIVLEGEEDPTSQFPFPPDTNERVSCVGFIGQEQARDLPEGQHIEITGQCRGREGGPTSMLNPFDGQNILLDACELQRIIPAVERESDAIEVPLTELVAAYSNELAADQEYSGKRLEVTGKLSFRPMLVLYILLYDEETGEQLICTFRSNDDANYLAAGHQRGRGLQVIHDKEGVEITVAGTCEGVGTYGVILGDCVILTPREEIDQTVADRKAQAQADRLAELERIEAEMLTEQQVVIVDEILGTGYRATGFLDKTAELSGTVVRVRSYGDSIEVILQPVDPDSQQVRCTFRSVHHDALRELERGDVVTVRGKVQGGGLMAIALANCIVVEE